MTMSGRATASKMGGSMMGAGGMMQMHAKMQADMKAMDDELDGLVVKMQESMMRGMMGKMGGGMKM